MGPDHIWLAERAWELASLQASIAALETGHARRPAAGVPARPGSRCLS